MTSLEASLAQYLELACQAQRADNILAGRQGILSLPREWVLEHIEALAEPLVQLNDDWEYRRLLEVYAILGLALVRRLADRAQSHPNAGIREAGQDFLDTVSGAEAA